MLSHTDELLEYLRGSAVVSFNRGVARYGDVQVELQIADTGSVSFTGSGQVQAAGSFTVFGDGDSLVPKSRTDVLAPYGQEVALFRSVMFGDVEYPFALGVFRVVGNSNHFEDVYLVGEPTVVAPADALAEAEPGMYFLPVGWVEDPPGSGLYPIPPGWVEDPPGSGLYLFPSMADQMNAMRSVVRGWSVDVDVADRLRMLERASLLESKSPQTGTMYSELQRLALFPVQVNPIIPDVNIPAGMIYEDGLVGAVYALAELAGAVPHMTRDGVLTLRVKDAWAEPDLDPVFDFDGTIEWRDAQSDDFHNRVRVSDPDGKYVAWAVLDDDSNPLSVDRAGPSDFEHVSPVYTSLAAARAGAATTLERVLNRRSREVRVELGLEGLLLELGDVGWVRDPTQGRAVLGEVSRIEVPFDVTSPVGVTLIVAEAA
ncbi:phage tail protein [Agromyces lapidis]|uniref:Phage tail protein n=1 Tax=Agromyces lapidis TaxID=279574 RepID=A0ABV5SMH3_9MICO|nr:phage tail protein [Agromyces lapidis]